MNRRILVAYASKYGATAEIAEKIGEVLNGAGLPTDVLPVKQVEELNFIEKRMIKMVDSPTGDFRDWEGIITWATTAAGALKEPVS